MARGSVRRRGAVDPTHYPVDDDVGEGLLQKVVTELLRPLLQQLLTARKQTALVGADQFIYWVQYEPTRSVAPDVYVLPGVAPNTRVDCWKVWETGVVPSFALEVVSRDWHKDYDEAPRRYAELGVRELVIFDPDADAAARGERVRWQVYRPIRGRGFVRVDASDGDRIRSRVLRCWLRAVGEGMECRLRAALDPAGDELVPTEAEQERAALEQERAAREAAEAEVARLRAELARLRRK